MVHPDEATNVEKWPQTHDKTHQKLVAWKGSPLRDWSTHVYVYVWMVPKHYWSPQKTAKNTLNIFVIQTYVC